MNCKIFGASFDTPADNQAFKDKFDFPFALLSDTDRTTGAAYEATREPGGDFENFPQRLSYLIDPGGVIRRAYEVDDPAGHAGVVLKDVRELTGN